MPGTVAGQQGKDFKRDDLPSLRSTDSYPMLARNLTRRVQKRSKQIKGMACDRRCHLAFHKGAERLWWCRDICHEDRRQDAIEPLFAPGREAFVEITTYTVASHAVLSSSCRSLPMRP